VDQISQARLQLVYPRLSEIVTQLMLQLEYESIETRITQALRSWNEQDKLYAQGRTTPGDKVTNCPGGKSYHNFGLAVDVVPSEFAPDQPYSPDWHPQHPTWKRMITLGTALGLTSGAAWRSFPDAPHFQFTGRFAVGEPDDEVRQLFKDGGMQAVWDEVSKSNQ
jgi:peptidoglycan L-alanyl-D-glutamate endopeptidase CwlK